jgi:hypothetical protein
MPFSMIIALFVASGLISAELKRRYQLTTLIANRIAHCWLSGHRGREFSIGRYSGLSVSSFVLINPDCHLVSITNSSTV